MARAGAHVGEAQLLEKLSDVALVEIDAEPGGDGVLEVGPSPAHDAVRLAIRPGLDDGGELGQLRSRQARLGALGPVVDQALGAGGVELYKFLFDLTDGKNWPARFHAATVCAFS